MTAADGILGVVLAGLTAYALLGGADFGGGVWDLLARGPRRSAQRELIARSMGPVWEANHVWLIFVLIALFSAFPPAFAALSRALVLPFGLALLGIVLRGSAFVFAGHDGHPRWGRVFAVASTATPLMLGVAAGSLPTGRLAADGSAGALAPFRSPLAMLAGVLALAVCAFLAAVFLCRDADDPLLAEDFRRRALWTSLVCGALALAGAPLLALSEGAAAGRFAHRGLPFLAVSVLAGVTAVVLLLRRSYGPARVAAALAPAAVLWGWAAALHPDVLPGQLTLAESTAPAATARAVLAVLLAGFALVLPSLLLLLRTYQRGEGG